MHGSKWMVCWFLFYVYVMCVLRANRMCVCIVWVDSLSLSSSLYLCLYLGNWEVTTTNMKTLKKHIQIPQYLNQTSEMEYNNSVFINSTYWHMPAFIIFRRPETYMRMSKCSNQSIYLPIDNGRQMENQFLFQSFMDFPLISSTV